MIITAPPVLPHAVSGGGNTVVINTPVTVNNNGTRGDAGTSGGGPMSPEQAQQLNNEITRTLRSVVATEIERQMRPGGMMSIG